MFLVMIGGAIGAGARYLAGGWLAALVGAPRFGTLCVNLIGGFAMGVLVGLLARQAGATEPARLLLGVGVLGGFTTFSAFALDCVTLLQRGDWGQAATYASLSVAGSVIALFAGVAAARAI